MCHINQKDSNLYQYHNFLYAYALNRTSDEETAKDLVQDTYLAALEYKDSYCEQSSLRTWLVAILKHKTYDFYRKRTLERTKIGVLSKEPYLEMFAGDYELFPLVRKIIQGFPPSWRNVITLNDLEGYSGKEICIRLKLSPSNYWVICHRARHNLRKSLRDFI